MSISAFERLSNEETHCKLAISAILKSLTKLFIQNQTLYNELSTMHQEEILLQICTFAENRILSRILAFWLIRRPPWSWKNQGELIFHWGDGPLGAKKNALYLGIAQIAIGPPCTQPGILGPGRSGTLEPIWEKSQNHLQTGARCLVHISHGCHSHIASGSGCRVGCTKISKSFRNSYLTWYMLYLYERRPKMQKKWFLGHFPRLATIL